MNDYLNLKGKVHIVLRDQYGNIKQEDYKDNLIVTAGKAFVASAITSASASPFTHVAVGSSSTAANVSQTALGTELARVAATVTNPTSTTANFQATYGAGVGTGTVEEAGIFNAGSSGTMFSRYLTGTYVKSASDTLTVDWTITIS